LAQQSVFDSFSEQIKEALKLASIMTPTPPQNDAIPHILEGKNVLLFAPTGTGKTEAALLPILNNFLKNRPDSGISIIYITPMRALNRDLLIRLNFWASKLKFTVEIRHGDTPQKDRRRQSEKPPDLLVTTPETLQAILPGKAMRKHLSTVRWVIIDEIHALVENKRGVQLTVGLERLREVTKNNLQIVGLSATIGSPEEATKFLVGEGRSIEMVHSAVQKTMKYYIEYPKPREEDQVVAQSLLIAPEPAARIGRISELVSDHESTLVFVNSRTIAEMLGHKFNVLRKDMAVHHSSLPKEERERVESQFKAKGLKGLVCTSTLELGIDIGSVDLAVQYMSPRQVSALIQRVGRAGHALTKDSEGIILAVSTDDIFESVATIACAKAGELEKLKIPKNAYDVLAHQIAGFALDHDGKLPSTQALTIVRRAYPFKELSEEDFAKVLNYLEALRIVKISDGKIAPSRRTREYYFQNLSMIPDERRYPVVDLSTQQTVGILGEEFILLKARVGVHFICKGRVWKIEKIADDMKVYVTPVDDPLAAIPGWDGELLPIPYQLAQRTGSLRREISEMLDRSEPNDVVKALANNVPAERNARTAIVEEIFEHKKMGATVPDNKTILIEGYDRYIVIHACFGDNINRTLGYVFEEALARKNLIRFWWSDGTRILIELTMEVQQIDLKKTADELFSLSWETAKQLFLNRIEKQFPYPERIKNIAQRFGVLKRGQYLGHPNLCSLDSRFAGTPIYEEAMHEVLMEKIDLDRADEVIARVKNHELQMNFFIATEKPTPIAYHILYRHLDVPELISPDTVVKDNVQRMKLALGYKAVDLICFNCGRKENRILIKDIAEQPVCKNCSSGLLAVSSWSSQSVVDVLSKKLARQEMNDAERDTLAKARRTADLVLSYGKKAVLAMSIYGVGPQTAAKILAKMHDDEESFYKDLLEAKLKFITTRPYWGN